MACPPMHLEYASRALAENAATLHLWSRPCPGFVAFPCGDHWHIGHPAKALGLVCRELNPGRPVRA